MSREVAIVDMGVGNLRSVQRALEACGARADVTSDPDAVGKASRVLVPGQGAFCDGMRGLSRGLGEAVRGAIAHGAPYLGICLGMQLLFDESEEGPLPRGLALLRGRVRRLRAAPPLKVPHMGWNEVAFSDGAPAHFYFAHSYVVEPADERGAWGWSDHGERFCAAVRRANLWAVQFHPEKSQQEGLALIARWLAS